MAPGSPGSGRVAVLVGHAGEGLYAPAVTGGADSCDRIKAWWDDCDAGRGIKDR